MSGLREPPKQERTSRVFARIFVLVLLLAVVATAIWAATTRALIVANEDVTFAELEVDTRLDLGGTSVNVVSEEGGPTPVILVNGYDIAGGAVWDGVVSALGEDYHAIRVDLPGFGLSDRQPEAGSVHTVAAMAQVLADVIESEVPELPVVAGVGLGGEVAAELAVTRPDLVRGLVLVDVDFWEEASWLRFAEGLPFVGQAVIYSFEAGGRFGIDTWAPHCGEGGWCPTQSQADARELAASIEDTTASLQAFLETRPASLVPSDLSLVSAPTVYIWSNQGAVSEANAQRAVEEIGTDAALIIGEDSQTHLESPHVVADAVESVDS